MKNFKMTSLAAAVAGVGALGAIGSAQAVNINPDGHGQVLIYPYYTVRSQAEVAPYQSLLSVVNSTASAKAVKVRFLEGRNSREVLDFNLFLSPFDVWVAGIVPTADGAGVYTPDVSCTVPVVSSSSAAPTPFVNFAYAGDGAGDSLDRTREGYVEIIEMGVVTGDLAKDVTHVNGVAPCKLVAAVTGSTTLITAPKGGLFGGMTLINVLAGESFTAEAVALDAFRTTGKYDLAGDIKPDLRDVDPPTAVIINGTSVLTSTAVNFDVDAVSALFMHDQVFNEFVLDSVTKSSTDWVLTMPTKRYYFNETTGKPFYLFQNNFGPNGACDDVEIKIWDREEQTRTTPPGFSPPPPAGKAGQLCWEANVMTFNEGNAFGSKNKVSVATTYQNGWTRLTFPTGSTTLYTGNYHELPMSDRTYIGLPVIGFAGQVFVNGTLSDAAGKAVQSNYGGNFAHKYTRAWLTVQ